MRFYSPKFTSEYGLSKDIVSDRYLSYYLGRDWWELGKDVFSKPWSEGWLSIRTDQVTTLCSTYAIYSIVFQSLLLQPHDKYNFVLAEVKSSRDVGRNEVFIFDTFTPHWLFKAIGHISIKNCGNNFIPFCF